MANYVNGVVEVSTVDKLTIRLMNNVLVEAGARPDLEYMDPVLVAYDFSTNSVRSVLRPGDIPHMNERPEVLEEEGEEVGDEEYAGNLLASRRVEDF